MATNTNKYLSLAGLSTFWGKVKKYVDNIDVTFTGDVESTDWLAISKSTTAPTAEGTKQIKFTVNSDVLTTKIAALDTKDGELTTAIDNEVTIAVQVNGKLRDKLIVALDTPNEKIEQLALALPKVIQNTSGLTVRKVIVIPNRLVNIVAN